MTAALQLWGGPECTIVRLGDRWRDQAAETGHRQRAGDLALIEALGIRTLRFPILWESVAPLRPGLCDFSRTDARLGELQTRGIEVIGGLLHHGSGPAYTELLDPDFPAKFADYAACVAERYPQIRRWTPVNEPLTTARFSCLYGHWYPHRRDYPAFLRALFNQCEGTRLAMAAIRRVIPGAELVQTEDIGKVFATAPLADQAVHENERRWLSLDLLAGRVTPTHVFYPFLVEAGIGAAEIAAFADGDAAPDLIGVNHYLTSERFLDHRTSLYPDLVPGGNGRDVYVDAEAVRVRNLAGACGLEARLHETWDRYRIPLAVTEVHHGCTREQQLRWFAESWTAAQRARQAGVALEAVTLWSLFGAMDWRSLLTREEFAYDAGALDARSAPPRPTALAHAAAACAAGGAPDHPVLAAPGWWRRPERLYAWCRDDLEAPAPAPAPGPPLLVTGATGTLGRALARIARQRGLACRLTSRDELDLCDPASIAAALARHRPWAVINAAGFVRVAEAERQSAACMASNAAGAGNLARACKAEGIPLLSFSSDLVFDGMLGRPYAEGDLVCPAGVYGQSKAMAERLVRAAGAAALIVRTSAFFGPWDQHNFAWSVLTHLRAGQPFGASTDIVSPTFVPDLCHAALDLLIDGETGIWHLANQGAVSWHGLAVTIARCAGFDPGLIFACEGPVRRNTALTSSRGTLLRPLEAALADWLRDVAAEPPGPGDEPLAVQSAAATAI
ncbi:MAG TPA: family 1 glycosylhydrolase [Allosphingosinicella sp.]|nr:family 1 glycosylhydrolase [Allosphingosinicella sp.]